MKERKKLRAGARKLLTEEWPEDVAAPEDIAMPESPCYAEENGDERDDMRTFRL